MSNALEDKQREIQAVLKQNKEIVEESQQKERLNGENARVIQSEN